MKSRMALGGLGDEVQKIPLRHEGDEFAVRRQMRKIANRHFLLPDADGEHAQLLVRALEELVDEAELVQILKRGGMNGVSAKVAQEIRVLFEHNDVDSGAGQKKTKHHAGRSA